MPSLRFVGGGAAGGDSSSSSSSAKRALGDISNTAADDGSTLGQQKQHTTAITTTSSNHPSNTHKKKRGRKKGYKKDPSLPKHPVSSYLYFSMEMRPQLQDQSGKRLGEIWRSMTASEKRKYEELALEDNRRYWREMAAYNARGNTGVDVCTNNTITPPPEQVDRVVRYI